MGTSILTRLFRLGKGDELGIGVIGVGGRGGLADHAHKPDQKVKIVAGADVSPAALTAFKAKYPNAFTTADYRDLLKRRDVDAVFVTSPDFLHEEHAVAALEAGKAVYLEKPMAITVAGCDRLLRTAFERKAKLYLGHNMRHMSFTRKMKQLIDGGAIGQVRAGWCRHFVSYGGDAYFKDWHAERAKSTGLLLQKGCHDIDILHWLCGGYTTRVSAMGSLSVYQQITDRHPPNEHGNAAFVESNWPPLNQKGLNPVIDVEDHSMMLMQLNNGVQCSYEQCHYTPDAWRNYTIIGTAGRIENFGDSPGDCQVRVWNNRCGYLAQGHDQHRIALTDGSHGGADPAIVAEFIQWVRTGGKIATSAVAARQAVAAGCLATDSLRSGNAPFDIPPVDPQIAAYFATDVM